MSQVLAAQDVGYVGSADVLLLEAGSLGAEAGAEEGDEVAVGEPGPSDPQQPAWCICTKCKEMPTDIERKRRGQLLDSCVSMLPHMNAHIMQGGVLRLARRIWNDIRAVADRPDPGEDNKQFRLVSIGQRIWEE
ncbi:unnamed protein product [Boreogadus saida]